MKSITLKPDICVAGGGMAGLCAAVAAARTGAKTVLVQDRPVLGGNASSEIRVHITGADCHARKPGWRETGIIEEVRLENLHRNPQQNYWFWDMILWETVKREPNLQLLLNTSIFEATAENDTITQARGLQLGSECIYTIIARQYIDCTGDGTLGAEAGAEFRMGREAREEFGESLAPEQADDATMGHSTPFTAQDTYAATPFKPFEWAYKFPTEESLKHRGGHGVCGRGFWWIELGGQDGRHIIHSTPEITEELWKITLGVWDHMKNYGDHCAGTWDLKSVAQIPGKRESRRFVGDYMLSQKDLDDEVKHDDEAAFGGWPADLHNIHGFWHPDPAALFHSIKTVYGIPLRTLYSRNIKNLFFAGRNHSATHAAMGSTRVMGTCSVMGQAAGTAAAFCIKYNCPPREVAAKHIDELRQTLLRNDCYLPHYAADDPADFAKQAKITASGSKPGNEPQKIIDGIARDIPQGETHSWESESLPAHVELEWTSAKKIRQVRITWDSELHRELSMRWYAPEYGRTLTQTPCSLARDYKIQEYRNDAWQTIADVKDNFQRHRVHDVAAETSRLRVVVERTWANPAARMFELRCY